MFRQRRRWIAASVGFLLAGLALVLLWPSNRPPPDRDPPADARTAETLQAPHTQPSDGVIRGVCGILISYGVPPPPGQPVSSSVLGQPGHVVSVMERDSGRKVAEAVSKAGGGFTVRVRPGAYRLVVDYAPREAFGKTTVEDVVELGADQEIDVKLLLSVIAP